MKNPIVRYVLDNHILTTVLLIGIGILLFQVKSILLALFMAFIIVAALSPIVNFLRRKNVPKLLAIVIVYVIIIAVIVVLVVPFIPIFVVQIQDFIKEIPFYLKDAGNIFGIQIDKTQITSIITPVANYISQNAVKLSSTIFGGLFTIVTTFILSFYLLIYHDKFEESLPGLFPEKYKLKVKETLKLVEEKVGAWLSGQLVLSLVIGSITWVILTILGIPFALPLAILAGFLEIIPTLGPIIAAVPAVIIGLAISPIMGLIVALAYVGIQFIENHFLVPKIMQKAVGLNPIIIIIGILIGGHLLGILGALLSIPFISATIIIIRAFRDI
jgi:predicted PurR-regulated permease PerM